MQTTFKRLCKSFLIGLCLFCATWLRAETNASLTNSTQHAITNNAQQPMTFLGIFSPLVESNHPPGMANRLIHVHDKTYQYFNGRILAADAYFGKNIQPPDDVPRDSCFGLELNLDIDNNFGELGINPRLDARLAIPRIEKRLHAFVDNVEPASLPGSDRTEERGDIKIGLRAFLHNQAKSFASMQGGVKFRTIPVLFGLLCLSKEKNIGRWRPGAKQEFFWYSDDKFGEFTEAWLVYTLNKRMPLSLHCGAKWTEQTPGIEFSQSLTLHYIITQDQGYDSDESANIKASWFEHKNGPFLTDKYRVSTGYRRRLFSHWLFGEISPQLDFKRESNWQPEFSIKLTMDILFFRDPSLH